MKRIAVFVVAIFVFACITPTEGCGCLPSLGIGTVAGVVRLATGAVAPGALVRVEARLTSCDLRESSELVDGPTTNADSTGRYLYHIRTVAPSDSACLRVVAHRADSPTGDSAVVTGVRVRLLAGDHLKGWGDSTRLDLQLP